MQASQPLPDTSPFLDLGESDQGTTVLMVEQNVKKALAVADCGHVLERGTLEAGGPARLLARSLSVHAIGAEPVRVPPAGTFARSQAQGETTTS